MGTSRVDVKAAIEEKSFSSVAKHPYSTLIKPVEELPEGVDPIQREVRSASIHLCFSLRWMLCISIYGFSSCHESV